MASQVTGPSSEFLALQDALAGRYSLIRELGRGGMGIVFLARDLALDRLVAIKLLPPSLAEATASRENFLREARTAAGLAHPHIVPIHAVEEVDRLVYFVMGFVDGETLGERVRRSGPLPIGDAMRVVQEVAWALGHAHSRGIVHRDVKPDNVLLEEGTGRALVTDFGIASTRGAPDESEHVLRGTPQYMSPEVAGGRTAEARSDLYSLGVTAWIAIAGRLPFEGDTAAAQLVARLRDPAPSLRAVARVPTGFADAVDRCLRADPVERWPSADALAAELQLLRARPPQVPAPARAFLREWESAGKEVTTAGTVAIVALSEAVVFRLLELAASAGAPSLEYAILSWIFLIIGVLTAGLAKARAVPLIGHARGVLQAGFDHARIVRAQVLDLAERSDERAATAKAERGDRANQLMLLAGTMLGSVGSFAAALSDTSGILIAVGSVGSVLLPALAIRTFLRLRGRKEEGSAWRRWLRGPLGRLVFRLAGSRRTPAPVHAALEGPEPTAIALGSAARDLYAELSPEIRAALGPGVESLIDALEQKAMAHGAARQVAGVPARSDDAVTALEMLRLDLLRLSAGSVTEPHLTVEFQRLRELGAEVDRQVQAADEVRQLLRPEPTPG